MQEKPSTYLDPSRHWCRAMNTLCLPEAHGRDVGTPGDGQAIKRTSFLGLKPLGAQQPPEPDMGVQHDLHHLIAGLVPLQRLRQAAVPGRSTQSRKRPEELVEPQPAQMPGKADRCLTISGWAGGWCAGRGGSRSRPWGTWRGRPRWRSKAPPPRHHTVRLLRALGWIIP